VLTSSESDSDLFPRASRASEHHSDGQEIIDEGHEADDETNALACGGRYEQQTDMDNRAGPIELKELNRRMDGHSKVDAAYSFICTRLIISLKVTIYASPDVPQLLNEPGKSAASPQTTKTKQSALPPLNPSPRDGLRRRTTARCDHIPVCFHAHADR
jgi:hypothetical protein